MDDFFHRQVSVLRRAIDDYRKGELSLNSLISRIEGIGDVLGIDTWSHAVFPIVLSMEQVNAMALESKRTLTSDEKASIHDCLLKFEALIRQFEIA